MQNLLGVGQMIFSGRRKAQRALDRLQMPTIESSGAISNYYNQALSRFNTQPTDTALYRRQQQAIGRNAAQGLSALQDRRSALAGVGRVVSGMNDASLQAEVMAEQERNRRFGELGSAARMKTEDDRFTFNVNKMLPFQRKDRLAQMRLGAANARFDAGLMNINNAINMMGMSDLSGMGGGKKFPSGAVAGATAGMVGGF